jgi:hypothetical protein
VPLYVGACIYVTDTLYCSYVVSLNRSDLYELHNVAFRPSAPVKCAAICCEELKLCTAGTIKCAVVKGVKRCGQCYTETGDNMFLRNVDKFLSEYTAPIPEYSILLRNSDTVDTFLLSVHAADEVSLWLLGPSLSVIIPNL